MNDSNIEQPPAKRAKYSETADSPSNIVTTLSDNLLQEIFYDFSIMELCNINRVCVRFRQNAEEIFMLRHEKRFRRVSLTLVKPEIVVNFGHLIKPALLSGRRANRYLDILNIKLVQSLHLRCAKVNFGKIKPLLSSLKSLNLSSCKPIGERIVSISLLSNCLNLESLKAKFSRFYMYTICNMPNLTKFEYVDYRFSENLVQFIEMNPKLSSISIKTVNKRKTAPIGFEQHLQHLANKQTLKRLRLPCFQFPVTSLLNSLRINNITMEQIELENCKLDAASFRDIEQMKFLTVLTLTGIEMLTSEQFVNLAKELPKLSMIRLETKYNYDAKITVADIKCFLQHAKNLHSLTIGIVNNMTIDQETYDSLLDLVKCNGHRSEPLTIKIVHSNEVNILVPDKLLMKNAQTICIYERKRNKDIYACTPKCGECVESDDDSYGSTSSEYEYTSDDDTIDNLENGEDSDGISDDGSILSAGDYFVDTSGDACMNDILHKGLALNFSTVSRC